MLLSEFPMFGSLGTCRCVTEKSSERTLSAAEHVHGKMMQLKNSD